MLFEDTERKKKKINFLGMVQFSKKINKNFFEQKLREAINLKKNGEPPRPTFMKSYFFLLSIKVRVCCDFCNKSTRMFWFSQQKNAYVVIFETKVRTLWFLQQKCAYVVIFTTTIVFKVFLVQSPVFPKFLVPTLAQFIGSCQQNSKQRPFKFFREKKKVLWNPIDID